MYPIGVLFGLGFDPSTEVALLFLAAGAAGSGLPFYAILCLPILFAAGMSLLDTIDGSFMDLLKACAQGLPQHHGHGLVGDDGACEPHDLDRRVARDKLEAPGPFRAWWETINIDTLGFIVVGCSPRSGQLRWTSGASDGSRSAGARTSQSLRASGSRALSPPSPRVSPFAASRQPSVSARANESGCAGTMGKGQVVPLACKADRSSRSERKRRQASRLGCDAPARERERSAASGKLLGPLLKVGLEGSLSRMSSRSEVGAEPAGHSRRSFLVGSGAVIGAVAVNVISPVAAIALEGKGAAADAPSVPVPRDPERLPDGPVMAYVSDAKRGEVTVLSGTRETTFHDPAVVRRLLKAARSHTS